jgi:hypothetical protein
MESHTKTLLESVQLISPEERKRLDSMQEELDRLRLDLQSLSHRRTVLDVVSRPVVNKAKRSSKQVQEKAYQTNRQGRGAASTVTADTKIVDVDAPIPIPSYHRDRPQAGYINGNRSSSSSSYNRGITRVEGVRGKTLLPSVHTGALPLELQGLRTQPRYINSTVNGKVGRNKAKSSNKSTIGDGSSGLLVHQLQRRFAATDKQLSSLQTSLASTQARLDKERVQSNKKMRVLMKSLQEQQIFRDSAVLAEVEQVVREAVEAFGDLVSEVDILDMLSDILAQTPFVEVEEYVNNGANRERTVHWADEMEVHEEDAAREEVHAEIHIAKAPKEDITTTGNALYTPFIYCLMHRTLSETAVQVEEEPVPSEAKQTQTEAPPPEPAVSAPEDAASPPTGAPFAASAASAVPPVQVVLQPLHIPSAPPASDALAPIQAMAELMKAWLQAQQSATQGQQALLLSLIQQLSSGRAENEQKDQEEDGKEVPPTPELPPPPPGDLLIYLHMCTYCIHND